MKRLAALIVAVVLLSLAPARAAVPQLYTPPASIDATCASDVTDALNRWVRSVPNGSLIYFSPDACYQLEGTLLLQKRHGLTIDGHGALLRAKTLGAGVRPTPVWMADKLWPRGRKHILVYDSSDVVIANLRIQGPNRGGPGTYRSSLEAQHGIEFAVCDRCAAWSNTISHTYGDGVSVGYGSERVTVMDNVIHHTGRQGLTVDAAKTVMLARNRLDYIGRSAIDLEPGRGGVVDTVVVHQNQIGGNVEGVVIAARGAGDVHRVSIKDNRSLVPFSVRFGHQDAFSSVHRARRTVAVSGNRGGQVFGSPIALMQFEHVQGLRVEGNFQRIATTQSRLAVYALQGKGYGVGRELVRFNDPALTSVRGNTFPGARRELTFRY